VQYINYGGDVYVCYGSHTAVDFAADYALGLWHITTYPTPPSPTIVEWETGISYGYHTSWVWYEGIIYFCDWAHTSGDFWTDYNDGDWIECSGGWEITSDDDMSNLLISFDIYNPWTNDEAWATGNYCGRLYISTDGGTVWNETQPLGNRNFYWDTIKGNETGSAYIVYGRNSGDLLGNSHLYLTVNGGTDWVETQPAGAIISNYAWYCLDIKGTTIIAGRFNGRLYLSTNTGTSWSEVTPAGASNKQWLSAAISGDSTNILVGMFNGYLYLSTDTGTTWAQQIPYGSGYDIWSALALDYDGSLVVSGGYVIGQLSIGLEEDLPIKFHATSEFLDFNSKRIKPYVDNTIDLGTSTNEFKNLYIDGIMYVDAIQIEAGDRIQFRDINIYITSDTVGHLDLTANISIDINADLNISAKNIITDTSTGTKIGTATNQKLGFFNATPIIQPVNTTDIKDTLIALGLLASGGATSLDLDGGSGIFGTTLTIASASITDSTGAISFDNENITTTGNLHVKGYYDNIIIVDDDYPATINDDVIIVDATEKSGVDNITLSLPSAYLQTGKVYYIKVINLVAGVTVTIDPVSGEQIEGAGTFVITIDREAYTIVSTGTSWEIINAYLLSAVVSVIDGGEA
jgi:hypothetical protein